MFFIHMRILKVTLSAMVVNMDVRGPKHCVCLPSEKRADAALGTRLADGQLGERKGRP